MGTILITAINAVFPIVALILFGYLLKRKGFFSENFLKIGSALVFKVCLPCMLFINVYEISGMDAIAWDLVIYCMAAVVALYLLGLALAVVTTKDMKRRGVIWQVTYRSNFAIIGIPLAAALGGSEAVSVAAVATAFVIPFYNIFSVIALSVFAGRETGGKLDVKGLLKGIITNPLTLSVLLGLACVLIRGLQRTFLGDVVFSFQRDTKFLYSVISNLSSMTTPFALMVLGGQCEFSAVRGMLKEITIGTVARIVVSPLLVIGCAVLLTRHTDLLHCGPNEFPALISLFGSPTAVSGAVMAGQMKNDEQLATQYVVWTSVCSIVTIFITVCLLMSAGLLVV